MYDCGSIIAKYILCGFNFLIFVIGGVILGLGIWLAADMDSLLGIVGASDETLKNILHPKFIQLAAYVIIVIGGLLFLISFLGYCGALVESQCMLITYGLILLVILIIQVVVGALTFVYRGNIEDDIKDELRETLKSYEPMGQNANPNNISISSVGWDLVQFQFQCCGVDNYTDFADNKKLKENNFTIPPACCHLNDERRPDDLNCFRNPTEENSNYNTGCFKILLNIVMQQFNIVIAIIIAVLSVEILAIFLAFCLAKMSGRKRIR